MSFTRYNKSAYVLLFGDDRHNICPPKLIDLNIHNAIQSANKEQNCTHPLVSVQICIIFLHKMRFTNHRRMSHITAVLKSKELLKGDLVIRDLHVFLFGL